jgi:hypothetical protein
MDAPTNEDFVKNILLWTTQCVNTKSITLKSWIDGEDNPFEKLQFSLLKGSPVEDIDEPCLNEQLFNLTDTTNKNLLMDIDSIDEKENPKDCLRNFRAAIAEHQLMKSLKSIDISDQNTSSEITKNQKLNIQIWSLITSEQEIIKKLSYQKALVYLYGKEPNFKWFTTQEELLLEYLEIQKNFEKYERIGIPFVNKEKNKKYEQKLKEIQSIIIQNRLVINAVKAFKENPSRKLLEEYIDQIKELEEIAPSPATKEILRIHSFARAIRIISEIAAKSPYRLSAGKPHINSDALTIIEQIIIMANNIENIDDKDKEKIKLVSKKCPLLRQDPQQSSLIFYEYHCPTLVKQKKWNAFYNACETIHAIVREFPIPYPFEIKKHSADYGAPCEQWSAEKFHKAINELAQWLPYNGDALSTSMIKTRAGIISHDSPEYKDILKKLRNYCLLLCQKNITHLDENDGENSLALCIFQDLFELTMILIFCKNTYKIKEKRIDKIIKHCDSIAKKCTKTLVANIEKKTGFVGTHENRDAAIDGAYFHFDGGPGGIIFEAYYKKAKSRLKNMLEEEEEIRRKEEQARLFLEKKAEKEKQEAQRIQKLREQEEEKQRLQQEKLKKDEESYSTEKKNSSVTMPPIVPLPDTIEPEIQPAEIHSTISEKIITIISWPFKILLAPFRFLSDFYWPFCG